MPIPISKSLELPNNVITQKLAWIGRTGSGKSYGFGKMAESMLKLGMQMVIIDPVGIHWGLRVASNGKDPGIKNIYVFGGLHKDIPLEVSSGRLIADFIADRHVSAVLDISQFESDADKVRFATDFASRFFFWYKRNPFPVHLCLEECQEMIPQNGMRGEERMIHAFNRIWKLGRNFGIGGSLISQRPQEVNKKALNQTECFFAFQMTGPHERKAIEDWMKEKGVDTTIANDLPKLEIGTCHVWSPQWLKLSKEIKIDKKWTYNASSTPEYGAKSVEIISLDPIEIEKLSEELKNSIEKAKENDPDILKKEVAQLRSKLAVSKIKHTAVDASVVSSLKAENKKLRSDISNLQDEVGNVAILREHITNLTVGIVKATSELSATMMELIKLKNIKLPKYVKHVVVDMSRPPSHNDFSNLSAHSTLAEDTMLFKNALKQIDAEDAAEGKLGRCEKAILTVLAGREGFPSTKTQVAILSGYRSGSGGFNNSLGRLRSLGYIIGSGEAITITKEGLHNMGDFTPLPAAGEDLQKYWYDHLPKCEGMVLKALVESYPDTLTKEQIGEVTGYKVGSGGFNNALGKLRTLELIKGYGNIIANESLFA